MYNAGENEVSGKTSRIDRQITLQFASDTHTQ